jgi:hypothetical protein
MNTEAAAARENKGGLSVAGAGAFSASPECGKVAHGSDRATTIDSPHLKPNKDADFNWPLSPFGFGRVTLAKASEDTRTEMPVVDDVDSPGILLNVVKSQTTVWFSARGARFARSCWREHEPARRLCWTRPRVSKRTIISRLDAAEQAPSTAS